MKDVPLSNQIMMTVWLPVLLLLSLSLPLAGGSPEITVFDKVATLYEGVQVNEVLATIECSDPDGDLTNTYIRSMTPANPCALCFEILDCLPNECLQYRAGVGSLRYASAQSYLLTIVCDDNNEPPATEVIEIIIKPNSPPYFDPDVLFQDLQRHGENTGPNVEIVDVDAIDDEGDDITYSLSVSPSSASPFFTIDSTNGKIRTTQDLSFHCAHGVTFEVTISDGSNTVGPQVINLAYIPTSSNTAPTASNLDTTVMIPEDATGTAYKMGLIDIEFFDDPTYTYTSTNAAGLAQFSLDGTNPNIDIATALDYENAALRRTDLVITVTDTECDSPPYNLRLEVTDVNEPPVLTPNQATIEICEGMREFEGGYTLTDPDASDTVTWSIHPSTTNLRGRFDINPVTGFLRTLVDYDVDGENGESPMFSPLRIVVQATDKGGLSATATVTVSIVDCNDNAPVIEFGMFGWATTECTAPGTVLRRIRATDEDSDREQNNVIYFTGSGGAVSMGTGGEIILNRPLPAGSVVTFEAYAHDRGQTPGPLRSENPIVISVRFLPCPTTPPPVTPAPTAAPAPTTAAPATTTQTTTTTQSSSFVREDDDPNLPWIIIAALLGTFLLGLLGFMLWRYGSLCVNACSKLSCDNACKRRPPRIRERPIIREPRRPPIQKEPRPPSEPKPEEPAGPGFLFGFWKERYPDDDLKNQPARRGLPTPGDMDYHYPHTLDPVEAPAGGQARP